MSHNFCESVDRLPRTSGRCWDLFSVEHRVFVRLRDKGRPPSRIRRISFGPSQPSGRPWKFRPVRPLFLFYFSGLSFFVTATYPLCSKKYFSFFISKFFVFYFFVTKLLSQKRHWLNFFFLCDFFISLKSFIKLKRNVAVFSSLLYKHIIYHTKSPISWVFC